MTMLLKYVNHRDITRPLWVLTQKTSLNELADKSGIYDNLEKYFKTFQRVLPVKYAASKKGNVVKIARNKTVYYLKQPMIFLLLVKLYKINPDMFKHLHPDFVHSIKSENIPSFISLYNLHAKHVLTLIDYKANEAIITDLLHSMWNHLGPFIDYYYNIFISIENHMQIEQHVQMLYQYTDEHIQINLFCEEKTKEYYNIITEIIEIVMWIRNVFKVTTGQVKISFYYLDNRKIFPHTFTPFTSNEMNSGSNIPGEWIQIWRVEEWRKVLIHELVHYYNQDTDDHTNSLGKQLYSLYKWNLDSDSPNEAITEVRAVILHTLYTTLQIMKQHKLKDTITIKDAFNQLLYYELCYSIVQTCKLLKYLKYDSLNDFVVKLSSPKRFLNQTVSVFSYIVLKTILLFDMVHDSFIFTDSVPSLLNYYANVWLRISTHPIVPYINSIVPLLQKWYVKHADDYMTFLSTNRLTLIELID